jgi:threonine dehydratase
VPAPSLGELAGCELFVKLENLQYTGSFKERGALTKLHSLSEDKARRGVIAMSAGNHAQGVAYNARRLGIPATIVMPDYAPFLKIERTRALGAEVVVAGSTIEAAAAAAEELAETRGLTNVHPYDDPLVVAGQGTVGLEMLSQVEALDCLVVPIGGGGLMSGIAIAAKALNPDIELVGVQTTAFPSMVDAIAGRTTKAASSTLADGIAVKAPGRLTRPIIEALVGDFLLVEESAIENAIHLLVERQKVVAEGAGAVALAGLLQTPERFRGRRVGLVISGGNIDARMLGSVLSLGLVRDGRLVWLRIELLDRPGQLARLTETVAACGGNVVELHHQRLFADVPAVRTDVDLLIETRNPEHVEEIVAGLEGAGFASRVLSSFSTPDPG